MHYKIDTWQEGKTWYAALSDCDIAELVGEGETEEDAILSLKVKVDDFQEQARFRWETRNDEP